MGREIAQSFRAEARQKDAERRYLETVRIRPPNLDSDLEAQLILHDLLTGASEEQRRLALLRLRGCSVLEAAQAQGMGVKRARRLLKELHSGCLALHSETERGLKFHDY
jgi:DNA-directed RNA polymerase specialized sigma24 family protein